MIMYLMLNEETKLIGDYIVKVNKFNLRIDSDLMQKIILFWLKDHPSSSINLELKALIEELEKKNNE